MNRDQFALDSKGYGRRIFNVDMPAEGSIQKRQGLSDILVQMRKTLHAHGTWHALVIKDFFGIGFQQHDDTPLSESS
jgi:hypothetical protein